MQYQGFLNEAQITSTWEAGKIEKTFKKLLLKGSLILRYDLETKKAGQAFWVEGTTWTKAEILTGGRVEKSQESLASPGALNLSLPLPSKTNNQKKKKTKQTPHIMDDINKHISKGLHRFGWMPTTFPQICWQTKHSTTLTSRPQTPAARHVPLGFSTYNSPLKEGR